MHRLAGLLRGHLQALATALFPVTEAFGDLHKRRVLRFDVVVIANLVFMTSVDALCQRVVLEQSAQTLRRVIHIGDGRITTDENDITVLHRKGLPVAPLCQFVKRVFGNAKVMFAAVLAFNFERWIWTARRPSR